jgi:periplasmic divalent cation tolerance protein
MDKNCCSVIMTTTDNKEIAKKLAVVLVESKLAACVQIDNVKSIFYFADNLQEVKEYRLMIKALSDNYGLIEQKIKEHHNYAIPEIIKLEIKEGLPQYITWIRETLTR